jgi:electron transfer flavoprotein alpha subunit/NAD-dependent dihydropyrimidine dehydrogenase PreA subunit
VAAIIVHKDKCTGCGICIQSCAYGSISIENQLAVINDSCQLCGICPSVCPFDAIEIIEEEKTEIDLSKYEGILIFGETKVSNISPVVYELIGKSRELADILGEKLYCVVLGHNIKKQARSLISYGVDEVYVYDDENLTNYKDDIYTDLIVDVVKSIKPSIFLLGATSIGRSLGPRIASRLQTGLTADCTALSIDSESLLLLQTRPAYGGNIMATIICPNSRPQMATVRYKIMQRAEMIPGYKGTVTNLEFVLYSIRNRVKVREVLREEREENIIEANIIVSGGNGLQKSEGFGLLEKLANCFGSEAAVGASRVAVDKGWIDYSHQVGFSGKTVRPRLYIACGISGSVQHLAGMSKSDFVVAINKDPSAPIFKVCDIGVIGDLYDVVPELIKELEKEK